MAKNSYLKGGLFSKTALTVGETTISFQIEKYLNARHIYNLRLNSGKAQKNGSWIHLCPAGTPDRFCIYRGVPVFIEVKRLGEKEKPEQLECHAKIRKSGGRVITAYDIDDIIRELKAIDELLNIPF